VISELEARARHVNQQNDRIVALDLAITDCVANLAAGSLENRRPVQPKDAPRTFRRIRFGGEGDLQDNWQQDRLKLISGFL
jgi:hypothetical protein